MYSGRALLVLSLHIVLVSAVHGPDDIVFPENYQSPPDSDSIQEKKQEDAAESSSSTTTKSLSLDEQMEIAEREYEEKMKKRKAAQERAAWYSTSTTDQPSSEEEEDSATTTKAFAGKGLGFHDPNLKIHDTNNAIKAVPLDVQKKKASKAAAAADKAEKMFSDATTKFEDSQRVYEETQAKLEQLRKQLEVKRKALHEKMQKAAQKKEAAMSNADRDELDRLNDLVDRLSEKQMANKASMESAKKIVLEQLYRVDAFYQAAEKSLDTLRKQAEKQFRGRDSDWANAEMERLMKAQQKLEKLRNLAADYHDFGHITPPEDAADPKDLSEKTLNELSEKLESANAEFRKQLGEYSTKEKEFTDAEDQQMGLRQKLEQAKREGKHLPPKNMPNHTDDEPASQAFLDALEEKEKVACEGKEKDKDCKQAHQAVVDALKEHMGENGALSGLDNALDQAEAEHLLNERKADLAERKDNFLKKKQRGEEKKAVKEIEMEKNKKRSAKKQEETSKKEAAVGLRKRKIAQKKRVQVNIERAIAIEIEVQREKMEKQMNVKSKSHHLRPKLATMHDDPTVPLPAAIHFDKDLDAQPIILPNDQMPEEDEAAIKKRLEDEALEKAPYDLDPPPRGRSLLEGDAVPIRQRRPATHDL